MKVKHLLLCLLFFLIGYPVAKFCLKKTDKFMLTEIQSDRPFDPLFETDPLSAEEQREIGVALNQKYTYFGCGGQAYVFFSDDGNYVIKFFKQRHFKEPTHLNYIPFIKNYRDLKYAKRKKRIRLDYGSYKIGFEEFPHETGLLYLHLNKTSHLKQKLTLVDKLNIEHAVDLDKTDFIIQRRAALVFDTIEKKMQWGDVKGAEETISSVIHLIVTRCKKGYADKDPNIATNCGILEGHAIKIDVGRLYVDPHIQNSLYFKPELYRLTRPFRLWLTQKHPTLVDHLDREVLRVIVHE